jgi:predicted nucleic acid-binding protein
MRTIFKVFVDTSAFVSLWDDKDTNRIKAINLQIKLEKLDAEIYTSSDVIGETLTVISKKIGKKQAVEFAERIVNSGVQVIFIDKYLHLETIEFFKKIKSKNISYIDCSSIVAMKNNKIQIAFSFDEHFKNMGVKLLGDVLK